MDPGVIQTPKHLVTGMGRKVTLKCKQHLGHNAMYWYKQSAQEPLKIMLAYNIKDVIENETASSRFKPHRPDNSQLDLQVDTLVPKDSALYLCASSEYTALHPQLLPVHKPPESHQEAVGVTDAQLSIPWRTQPETPDPPAALSAHCVQQC